MPSKVVEMSCECKHISFKIGEITVNVKSNFYPQKSLYDIFFSIASTKLKEKSA